MTETISTETILLAFRKTIALLRSAQCPTCPGDGAIAVKDHEGEWHAQECPWCAQRDELIGSEE